MPNFKLNIETTAPGKQSIRGVHNKYEMLYVFISVLHNILQQRNDEMQFIHVSYSYHSYSYPYDFNSLWSNDVIWSGLCQATLAQVMFCRLAGNL